MKRTMTIAAAGLALLAGGWMSVQPEGMEMPDMDQMMAMFEAASKPDADQHAMLKKMAGDWTITAKFKMDPNSPPEVSKGTSKNTLVLGGRQLMAEVDMKMMFMGEEREFTGVGMMGYNKSTKEFENIWTDTMSTGQMWQTGTVEGDTIVVEGKSTTIMGTHTVKNVIRFVDGGYDMEFWEKGDMVGPEYMNTGIIEYRK